MKRILVTGASGFLGWNICQEARNDWNVYGTVFSHPVIIAGVNTIQIDLTDYKELKTLFDEVRPEAVIHTAAAAFPNYCQENRDESRKINVDASINIAGLCADNKIPFVFTSTDLVFDGLNVPYSEEDQVGPVNVYGEQKVKAEEGILKRYPEAAVCRMPLMFGNSWQEESGFFQSMVNALEEGTELKLFADEYRTPISGQTASQGLILALNKVHGLLHLGGRESVSRYNFGLLMMDVLEIHKARFVRCLQKDVVLCAPRPLDVSLDSSKAFALGFNPPSLKDELGMLL